MGKAAERHYPVSKRTRILLICSVIAILAAAAGLVVGLASGRLLQALPAVAVGVIVPTLYLQSRRAEQRDADGASGVGRHR